MWYTQEFGYKAGSKITDDMSGGMLQYVTSLASIMGMFVLGGLIERWVNITFTPKVSTVKLQQGAYIEWDKLPKGAEGIKQALIEYKNGKGLSLTPEKVTTLQDNLNSLIPGLATLLLTFLCMWLFEEESFSDHYYHCDFYRRYFKATWSVYFKRLLRRSCFM